MTHPTRRTFDKIKAKAKMAVAGIETYAELARAMGVERQTVGHWFRDRGEPNVQQMKEMAAVLGCHWLELVDEQTLVVFQEEERRRLERLRALSPEALAKLDAFLAIEGSQKDGGQ